MLSIKRERNSSLDKTLPWHRRAPLTGSPYHQSVSTAFPQRRPHVIQRTKLEAPSNNESVQNQPSRSKATAAAELQRRDNFGGWSGKATV